MNKKMCLRQTEHDGLEATERQEKSPDDFSYEGDAEAEALTSNIPRAGQDDGPFVRVDSPDDFE